MNYLNNNYILDIKVLSEEDKIFLVLYDQIPIIDHSNKRLYLFAPEQCIMIASPHSSINNPKFIASASIQKTDTGIAMEDIIVIEEYRGKGYGKKLCNAAIKYMNVDEVSVLKDNQIAYSLYKNLGFRAVNYDTENKLIKMLKF